MKLFGIRKPKGISPLEVPTISPLTSVTTDKDKASPSNCGQAEAPWKSLWSLNIFPRAKISMWKIINNAIPTNSNIAIRGISTNLGCFLCGGAWSQPNTYSGGVSFLPNFSPEFMEFVSLYQMRLEIYGLLELYVLKSVEGGAEQSDYHLMGAMEFKKQLQKFKPTARH